MAPLPPQDLDHILSHTQGLWEDLRGQSLFLTGGTGFVGAWLLESLLRANDEMDLRTKVVLLTRDPGRFCSRSQYLARHPSVHLLGGNVTGFAFPDGNFPFVIHAATEPSLEPDAAHPLGAFDADIDGTRRVLEFARSHGAHRFLLTSSGAVYGKQPPDMTHIPEEYAGAPLTTDPASAYGQAKRVSEFMSVMYGGMYGFDAVIARLFAFVGPQLPLDANYAVGNFIRDALLGGPVLITGDGTPFRSYLYAADLAIWLWTMLFRGKAAHPYNVGSPDDLTIADLARTVIGVVAPATGIDLAKMPIPGVPPERYVPSTTRAEEELGLRPLISTAEGIRRTSHWYRTTDCTCGAGRHDLGGGVMEVVVLAGGLGTRLRGLVPNVPKPMAPVSGRPFLEILLASLARKGCSRVVLSLGYKAESVVDHFGDHFAGMDLIYEIERAPLGTGGALRRALAQCRSDHVFVLNGDTYLDLEVDEIKAQWQQHRIPIIVARDMPDTARYGRLDTSGSRVVGFVEKGVAGHGLINVGSYVFPRTIASEFPADEAFSLEHDFLTKAVSRFPFNFFVSRGHFIDIGVPEDYARAQEELAEIGL